MDLGDRLRQFRQLKNLSQGDIEARTGLLRCYVSRVEHGHTVPSLETLEKLSRALEVPLYQLFYSAENKEENTSRESDRDDRWPDTRRHQRIFAKLKNSLSCMSQADRKLLLFVAYQMVRRKKKPARLP